MIRYHREMASIPWTTVQRDPKMAAEAAEAADVVLNRRDAPDLVLGLASRKDEQVAALDAVGRLMAELVSSADRPRVERSLAHQFGWMSLLPPDRRTEFVDEFITTVRGAAELNRLELIAHCLSGWRATAEIYADPELRERLMAALSGAGQVISRPKRRG